MQLKKRRKKRAGQVRERLAAVSATLLAAGLTAHADEALAQQQYYDGSSGYEKFGPGIAYGELTGAYLIYKESGDRVQTMEPSTDMTMHGPNGQALSLGFTIDSISGATPTGAVPSDQPQTFVTPLKAQGSTTTVTTASGGSTVIQLPPTPGQVAAAVLGRQYTVPANTLPVDRGFYDHRTAFDFSYAQPLFGLSQVGIGGAYSTERDYRAISGNINFSQNFNGNNTTLSLALNTELDTSTPYGGVPTPLTDMSGQWKSPSSRDKTQLGFVLGLTEVMSRRWLMQLNYAFDMQNGYLTDPYRILSVVDSVSGEPVNNVYESRPGSRRTQSIFWDNKFDYGAFITDLSLRYFTDSWGIHSETAALSERVNVTRWLYVEPNIRWYHQSSASFFRNYLIDGQSLPAYASSDTRLEKFTALTYGLKLAVKPTASTEIYLRGEYYRQNGNGHPADAIGQLKQQNLFAGTNAAFVLLGATWDFR